MILRTSQGFLPSLIANLVRVLACTGLGDSNLFLGPLQEAMQGARSEPRPALDSSHCGVLLRFTGRLPKFVVVRSVLLVLFSSPCTTFCNLKNGSSITRFAKELDAPRARRGEHGGIQSVVPRGRGTESYACSPLALKY